MRPGLVSGRYPSARGEPLTPDHDLILRGGVLVTAAGEFAADVAVTEGVVTAIGQVLASTGAEEIDARGIHLFPGGVDPHVHFNEPGRTDWEGFATGSAALAAGGFTSFVDMPLNSTPALVDVAAFDSKLRAAEASSLVDFGLWGGLVPGDLGRLDELAERGVVGFKAFMCPSGVDDFPYADDLTLLEGMRRCADLGSIVLVHAENAAITTGLGRRAVVEGRLGARDFVRSRPVVAELEAIGRALAMAGETGCAVHIVHVSTARGVELVREARDRGVDASCETCPHYLVFTDDDLERLGAGAKCAPPLRTAADRDALWLLLLAGTLEMVTSDHSPAPPELKDGEDFFAIWGGIAGCQTTRQVLLAEGGRRGLPLPAVARATAKAAARRFRLAGKGDIAVGADADLALIDLGHEASLRTEDLRYRHRSNPFVGRPMRGRTVRTILRGQTVFKGGRIVAGPSGHLLRPAGEPRAAFHRA